jgi:protein ImuA
LFRLSAVDKMRTLIAKIFSNLAKEKGVHMSSKAELLNRLRKEVAALQGHRRAAAGNDAVSQLSAINEAFPQGGFPLAGLHEFFCSAPEEQTAARAFVSGLLSTSRQQEGAIIWIGTPPLPFPPALTRFGIHPHQVIFLELRNEKEITWALGEALKCEVLQAVVGELRELSLTSSRRLQLAIEQSGVPCFLLRYQPRNGTTTSHTRWQVSPLPSLAEDGLPGLGPPRWKVELLKARNGRPGTWELEWVSGRFRHAEAPLVQAAPTRKAS